MNKQEARELGAATEAALAEVAQRFGMSVEVRGGSYDAAANTFRPKVEYRAADSGRVEFERLAPSFGVDPAIYGKTFTHAGRSFEVVALNARAPKYPLQGRELSSGRTFKFTESTLRRIA